MAIADFNKFKALDVRSVTGTPTVAQTVPVKITSGDDTTTGTGEIVLDWTNISSKSDIGIYDENDNLLDYYFESFDSGNSTAVIHVYRSWTRDGTTQLKVAYGSGPSDQSVSASTVFDKETNLQAGWLFNESSGDALDVTSNNNDGTVNGATQGATGIVDGAYDFDDSNNEYVNVGDQDSLDFSGGSFSLSGWIYLDDSGVRHYLFGKGFGGNNRYFIERNSDGTLEFQLNNLSTQRLILTSGTYVSDTWYHIVGVVDATNEIIRLYVDGTEVGSDSGSIPNVDNSLRFTIGAGDDGSIANYHDGKIDNIRVREKVLSTEEISTETDSTKLTPDFFSQQAAETTSTTSTASIQSSTVTTLSATTSKTGSTTATIQPITVTSLTSTENTTQNATGSITSNGATVLTSTASTTQNATASVHKTTVSVLTSLGIGITGPYAHITDSTVTPLTASSPIVVTTASIQTSTVTSLSATTTRITNPTASITSINASPLTGTIFSDTTATLSIQTTNVTSLSATTDATGSTTATIEKIQTVVLTGAGEPKVTSTASIQTITVTTLEMKLFIPEVFLPTKVLYTTKNKYVIMESHTFKKGDTADELEVTLEQDNGSFSLTTIKDAKLYVQDRDGNIILDGVDMDVTDETNGKLEYDFSDGSLINTPGIYKGEIKISWPNGKEQTFPNDGTFSLTIDEDLE